MSVYCINTLSGRDAMTEEFELKMSALCQSVSREGKTVDVDIYENGEGGWILEVVDGYGNSTVWDDPFTTDQDALDEVMRTIEDEGIGSLIEAPVGRGH
jgi:hypothetical protein